MSNCPWCNRWLWPQRSQNITACSQGQQTAVGGLIGSSTPPVITFHWNLWYWAQDFKFLSSSLCFLSFTSYFPPTVKRWHLYLSQEAPPAGAPLSFKTKGMVTFPKWDTSPSSVTLQHFVRPPWQFTSTHLYSWVERSTVSRSKVSCLKTQHYNLTWSQT